MSMFENEQDLFLAVIEAKKMVSNLKRTQITVPQEFIKGALAL